jgi:hypothetical protein
MTSPTGTAGVAGTSGVGCRRFRDIARLHPPRPDTRAVTKRNGPRDPPCQECRARDAAPSVAVVPPPRPAGVLRTDHRVSSRRGRGGGRSGAVQGAGGPGPAQADVDDRLGRRREICVCDITPHFAVSGPTISHHLRVMREAGLVDCEQRGTWVYYWPVSSSRSARTRRSISPRIGRTAATPRPAGVVGALVATAHRDDDVGGLDDVVGQRPGELLADVDADLGRRRGGRAVRRPSVSGRRCGGRRTARSAWSSGGSGAGDAGWRIGGRPATPPELSQSVRRLSSAAHSGLMPAAQGECRSRAAASGQIPGRNP